MPPQSNTDTYDDIARRGGDAAMRQLGRFFTMDDPVHDTLRKIARRLKELDIEYAVVGAMALNAHGYRRATLDVDMLVTPADLARIHEALEGLGYITPFKGSKHLKDTAITVRIKFLVSGQYPGDGKPKPLAFPDPRDVAVEIDGVQYANLPTLISLKLASGMTNPSRLKDLGDVQEVIRTLNLPRDFAAKLHPFVRAEYERMWDVVSQNPAEPS